MAHNSYDLIMLIDGSWMFSASSIAVARGSLPKIVKLMVNHYDFSFSEIELALSVMDEEGHDRANFGTFRTFIFSSDRDESIKGVA
jgi:hypothetical protein